MILKMNGIRPLKNSDLMSMHYLMNMLKNLTYLKVTRLIKPGQTVDKAPSCEGAFLVS